MRRSDRRSSLDAAPMEVPSVEDLRAALDAGAIISAVGTGAVSATTTVEVIQEFAHVRARRTGRADAAAVANRFAALLSPLVTVDADDLTDGLVLFREHERLGAFDAVLAAVAARRPQLTTLVSADRAFAGIPGVEHRAPGDDRLREMLTAG